MSGYPYQIFNGLADDLKVANYGILGFAVFKESHFACLHIYFDPADTVMYVMDIDSLVFAHNGAASPRMRSLR